jgi:alpha/beta superfamily hydrolase
MGMIPEYQNLHNQIKELRFQVHDALDDPSHPTARNLHAEMQHLEDELEQGKNARDIENRVRAIQHGMLEARSNPNSFMSIPDADHFHRTFEDIRQNIRRFPNY